MDAAVRQQARERMKGYCRVCPVCDGRACAGEVPGMGGLGTGSAFRANVEALKKVRLAMRCLHRAVQPNLACSVLGLDLALPVLAAPIGGVSFNMGGGPVTEADYADAIMLGCRDAGIIGCGGDGVGDVIHECAFESIRKAGGHGIPFIKPWDGEELNRKLDKAAATGCPVIGVDVDAAGLITLRKLGRPVSPKSPEDLADMAARVHGAGCKFMIKGVMTEDEARIAADAGVDAIVVSNHGGRVLDHTPGTAEVLPEIVKAVRGRVDVLADGGIRDGVDILKMLALGAQAVLVGRPFSTAAVGGGRDGVAAYIEDLRAGLTAAMTLTGCADISSVGPHILA